MNRAPGPRVVYDTFGPILRQVVSYSRIPSQELFPTKGPVPPEHMIGRVDDLGSLVTQLEAGVTKLSPVLVVRAKQASVMQQSLGYVEQGRTP